MSLLTIATYLLLTPFNKLVLDYISRLLNERGRGWDVAVPLALIGAVLELGRVLFIQEGVVLYISSALNYITYYIAALLLIKRVYGPGLVNTLFFWIIFSIIELFMYALLSVFMFLML